MCAVLRSHESSRSVWSSSISISWTVKNSDWPGCVLRITCYRETTQTEVGKYQLYSISMLYLTRLTTISYFIHLNRHLKYMEKFWTDSNHMWLAAPRRFMLIKLIEAERRIYASVNYAIIGSDNSLSPIRCQAIIWTNAGIVSIGSLGTNFSEIWMAINIFSFTKMHLKMPSAKVAAILSRCQWANKSTYGVPHGSALGPKLFAIYTFRKSYHNRHCFTSHVYMYMQMVHVLLI